MTAELSRRGLFRAFRLPGQPDDAPVAGAATHEHFVARIGDRCVEPRGVLCRRCGDECDAHAISFRLLGKGKAQALLDADICTGCGTCLPVCPTAAIELIPVERLALATGLAELGRTA